MFFVNAMIYGLGVTMGGSFGLLFFLCMKVLLDRWTGVDDRWQSQMELNEQILEALRRRNDLTSGIKEAVETIADIKSTKDGLTWYEVWTNGECVGHVTGFDRDDAREAAGRRFPGFTEVLER